MIVTPIKTKKVIVGDTIENILDNALPPLGESSILVVSAKIVAICEGNVIKTDAGIGKDELAKKEADYFIFNKKFYEEKKTVLTIKNDIVIPSAGVDESNGNGYFILWPRDPMQSALNIWAYCKKKWSINHLGIIISDSYFVPLRRGTVGVGIAWCGFNPITNYIGKEDIFGRKLMYTTASRIDGLAAAAEVTMGEGSEQTPLALIEDIPFVEFTDKAPSPKEIAFMRIPKEEDSYGILLDAVGWEKGHLK